MPLLPIVLIALANSPAPVLRPIAPVAPASEDDASRRTRNFARLVFSVNRGTGISSTDWNVLTRYADLVAGLDGHGYEFPGYLDDFRIAAPGKRVYGFATAMGLQRDPVQDGRFRALDRSEDAFLHVSDPASFVAVVLQGATRLHWVRDHRKDAGASYPNPIGVTSYAIESAPAADGPWTPAGAPVAEAGSPTTRPPSRRRTPRAGIGSARVSRTPARSPSSRGPRSPIRARRASPGSGSTAT